MDASKKVANIVEGDVDGDVTQVGVTGSDDVAEVTNVVRGTVRGAVLQIGVVQGEVIERGH